MKLLKNWKIILLILALIISVYMLIPSMEKGVVVKSIAYDSPFQGKLRVGEIISWANENPIESSSDFYELDGYVGVIRFMHDGELELVDSKGSLGVIVVDISPTKLSLGMDLVGGTRILMAPIENVSSEVIDQAMVTLETRINTYGLRESSFEKITDISGNSYIQVEMAGGSKEEIDELLAKQGNFEGKIAIMVETNATGGLTINDNTYLVTNNNDSIVLDGQVMNYNDTVDIEGVPVSFLNKTDDYVVFLATIFESQDIKSVCMQDQQGICVSRVTPQSNGYQFMFQVYTTEESAERFAKVTKNLGVVVNPSTGGASLDGQLYLFLDDNMITQLSIESSLAGKAYTTPLITGYREDRESTVKEKLKLQSILQSGSLPVKLEILRVDEISPTLGQEFVRSAMLAGLIAALAVSVIIFIRYRNVKILLPVLFTSLCEVIIILGAAAWIKWTIDLSAIAGIIAAVGTGVDAQIMVIDELKLGSEKAYSLKQKIKRAFFIIFGAASTTIAAMLPLMFIGIGVMKGFAITTALGVLIGVLITRPAFGVMIEKVLDK